MSIKDFLLQPNDACKLCLSIGKPETGKSYIALNCLEYWMQQKTFQKIVLILPQYNMEQHDSYKFIKEYSGDVDIQISTQFRNQILDSLIDEHKKHFKKTGKRLRSLFLCDDTTSQSGSTFGSEALTKLATEGRHVGVHGWVILHYNRGIIPPKVREQIRFVFVYELSEKGYKEIFDSYITIPRMRFQDFYEIVVENIFNQEYGCLMIDTKQRKLNGNVCRWFAYKNKS